MLTLGLDPGLGIFHATQRWRDSFVFDVMEPVRPVVDDYVIDLLEDRTFEKTDFFENKRGIVRIMPPLIQELAETAPQWTEVVGSVAEQLATLLVEYGDSGSRGTLSRKQGSTRKGKVLATPLTEAYRRNGEPRGERKRRRKLQNHWETNQEWNRTNGQGDTQELDYEAEILPGLEDVPLKEIAAATGLSLSYSSAIRSGKQVPHRRHWKNLLSIGVQA